jgi:alpha-beta hydrolase superfamily lysophospholipase
MVRGWHLGVPVFLLGHSLGGLIVPYYLLDQQDDLAGVVLSGPSVVVPEGVSPLTILIGKVLSALAPKARLVGVVDPMGICGDPQVVEAYVDDPLVHIGRLTARLGVESLKAQQRVEAEAAQIALPVLIVQGGADRLVDPAGAQMLYDTIRSRSRDKTLKVYDGFHHELHNEPGRAQVLGDVEAWLEAHI